MQLYKQQARPSVRAQRSCRAARSPRSRPALLAQATTTTTAEPRTAAADADGSSSGLAPIYVGFGKNELEKRKSGAQGRVIMDDPAKYPGKEDVGFLPGATGGWAGGEAGLWQLREQVLKEMDGKNKGSSSAASSSSSKATQPPRPKDGLAPIYVGYGKDELEKRKSGEPGRFVLDNPAKYPGKDDIGPFPGATGGFAGGEKGLKQFVATGEVTLRQPGQPGSRQTSPVAIAGLLVAAGAGGGLLLNEVTDLGETAVKAEIVNAPIDDKTKALLLAAVVLLGGVGVIAAGRATVSSLQSRISSAGDGATKLVVAGAFWLAVFFAARFVLEL